ncbi:MAG TPA: ABC transporter permease, partial [Puia sp.]|nr:ABC transporter permease [Puia sp.]
MFKNYFKIAWRNLMKYKMFTFINIFGLSLSVSFCMLLFMYLRYEQSYDGFHSKKDRLYRLETANLYGPVAQKPEKNFFGWLTKNDEVDNELSFAMQLEPDMQSRFPEIINMTGFSRQGTVMIKAANHVFKEDRVLYTDTNFFKSLSFHLLSGNPSTVLRTGNSAVISRSTAQKYFGTANPVGKTLAREGDKGEELSVVTGVFEDVPQNSSIAFDILLPNEAIPQYRNFISDRLNHSTHIMILELAPGVNLKAFEKKINDWYSSYYVRPFAERYAKSFENLDISKIRLSLRPLTDGHYNVSSGWGHYTNAKNIYQLACLVLVILLIASLNYILLAVSSAASRSQEVGVRKVMGAARYSIILQFWVETQIIVCLAVVASLILTNFLLPMFNIIIDSKLEMDDFSWKEIFAALLLLSLLLGVLAGYYPARLMSRMKPASILKSFQTFKVNPRFSRILVVAQYSVCIVLIIAAIVINRQMQFISNKDLGFDKDQVLMISNQTWDPVFTKLIRDRLFSFASKEPSVLNSAVLNGGLDGRANMNGFKLNGEQKFYREISVDYDYFKMLNLKLINGRLFSKAISSDSSSHQRRVVVNQTLWNMLGDSAKLGVFNESIYRVIIGVVKDYHFASLTDKIQPQAHTLATRWVDKFIFKIKAGKMSEEISRMEKEWKSITGNYPFEYSFLDQSIEKMYKPE